MYLSDSEGEDIIDMYLQDSDDELIIKFTKGKKVTFDESKNKTYFISDTIYMIKQTVLSKALQKVLNKV